MRLVLWLAVALMGAVRAEAQHRAEVDTLATLRRRIEMHPNDIAAHEQFVQMVESSVIVRTRERYDSTFAKAVEQLERQYHRWLGRFPRAAGVRYGYGLIFSNEEDPRARPYLLDAVRLDPGLAKAYDLLAQDAERQGDDSLARKWLARAVTADSSNQDYAFSYAFSFQTVDPARWRNA